MSRLFCFLLCSIGFGGIFSASFAAESSREELRGDLTIFAYPPNNVLSANEEVYKEVNDVALHLYIFEPEGHNASDRKPAIVFFFGGGFQFGSPGQFVKQCEYFASRGMVAVTVDYRVATRNKTSALDAVEDGRDAVRWLRANAARLGIDPERIVVSGGSAGGLLAACTGFPSAVERGSGSEVTSSVADALILFNPAVMGVSREKSSVVFPSEMRPYENITKEQSPCLLLFGGKDKLLVEAKEYQEKALSYGNRCELKVWDGLGHGFFNFERDGNKPFVETLVEADKFLESIGYLSGEPTVTLVEGGFVYFDGSPVHSKRELVIKYGEAFVDSQDKDGDGRLSPDEFWMLRERVRLGMFAVPDEIIAEYDVEYGRAGERRLVLDTYRSRKQSREPVPAIVWIHGGGWRKGSKEMGKGRLMEFVPGGRYVGFSVGYRLTGEAIWPAQIHDCKAAIRWIRANAGKYNIDPDRIGIAGHSAGGHLVSLLGTSGDHEALEGDNGSPGISSRVSCVVDFAGVSDLVTMAKIKAERNARKKGRQKPGMLEMLFGGDLDGKEDLLKLASPLTYVSEDDPAFFILHGVADPVVDFESQGEGIHKAFRAVGVDSVVVRVEDGRHVLKGMEGITSDRRILSFFDKQLRGVDCKVFSESLPTLKPYPKPVVEE